MSSAVPVIATQDVEATADLVAHTWGVEVKLTASGLRPGERYEVAVLGARRRVPGRGVPGNRR